MPSRILREGILTSERVDKLGAQAELFYRRLMSVIDDFGRYYAHPALLRSACYPLRVDVVREADISRWLTEVESAGLIALYAVNGKRYLEMIDFRQQIRAKESKFLGPPSLTPCESNDKQLKINCESNDSGEQVDSSTSAHPNSSSNSSSEEGDARGRNIPPTVEEVRLYCADRGKGVDAEAFMDFYIANGWVQGSRGKPIKNWQAAVRTWEKNEFQPRGSNGPRKVPHFRLPTPEDPRDRIE